MGQIPKSVTEQGTA